MGFALCRIALLIDADNVADLTSSQLATALSQLAEFGQVSLRRAYGNWNKPNLEPLAKILHEFAVVPVQQFDYTSGKNATDIALTIDAMDLMHGGNFDTFSIISCDSDFTPLAVRLRNEGMTVYGFGRRNKTAVAFREACTKFFNLDACYQSQQSDSAGKSSKENLKKAKNTNAAALSKSSSTATAVTIEPIFREAVNKNLDQSGWANAAAVGTYLYQQKKLKDKYQTKTWVKYYQKFPTIFQVKTSKGKTLIRPRPQ